MRRECDVIIVHTGAKSHFLSINSSKINEKFEFWCLKIEKFNDFQNDFWAGKLLDFLSQCVALQFSKYEEKERQNGPNYCQAVVLCRNFLASIYDFSLLSLSLE